MGYVVLNIKDAVWNCLPSALAGWVGAVQCCSTLHPYSSVTWHLACDDLCRWCAPKMHFVRGTHN